jgi:hypothetical protein
MNYINGIGSMRLQGRETDVSEVASNARFLAHQRLNSVSHRYGPPSLCPDFFLVVQPVRQTSLNALAMSP